MRNTAHSLEIRTFPGGASSARLRPNITTLSEPFYAKLRQGILSVQSCERCEKKTFPPAPVCPACHCEKLGWTELSGDGAAFSWCRYQRSYTEEFKSLVPYIVLAVRMDGGPILFGRWVETVLRPAIGDRVSAIVERWQDGFTSLGFIRGGAGR
jgi:uncharacterized protein